MGCTLRFWSAGHHMSAVCRLAERAGATGPEPRSARRRRKPGGLSAGPPRTLHYGVISPSEKQQKVQLSEEAMISLPLHLGESLCSSRYIFIRLFSGSYTGRSEARAGIRLPATSIS